MISILRAVYIGESPDRQDRVSKVLALWRTKQFYDENTMQHYESQMSTDAPIPENAPTEEEDDDIPPWQRQEFSSSAPSQPPPPSHPPPGAYPPWQPPPPGMESNSYYNNEGKRQFEGGSEPISKRMRVE